MVISKHATEFAGYPVEDYDPAVGILLTVMPRREFRSRDDKSNKFWAIALDGDRHTILFGRTGTAGQTQTKKFPSAVEARVAYRKLVHEKVDKGYAEVVLHREFQLVEGKSQKFWTVTLEGAQFTIQFGRIGTDGQAQTKEFPSPVEARAACAKLIAEKVGKGYTERPPAELAPRSVRDALVAALVANPDDQASHMAFADYLTEQGEPGPAVVYRVNSQDYEEPAQLAAFLADPAVSTVRGLVVGYCWDFEGDSSGAVEDLVAARNKLLNLQALFLGEMTYEQQEISWIQQSDLTPLFKAYPRLEHFSARGGGGLRLGKLKHEHLKSLTFEASNLPREVVRAVGASDLPALEHLEVWLGTSTYGADTTVADLKGILDGKGLPALRYLGLRNSEIADDVAKALAKAPVLERLKVLDLSLGTLSDKGAQALLAIPALAKLEKLDIHHHYVSPKVVGQLKALGIEVDAGDPQEADIEGDEDEEASYRYVAHSE
jgi:uncharacterized protein (TIGR02996 family)